MKIHKAEHLKIFITAEHNEISLRLSQRKIVRIFRDSVICPYNTIPEKTLLPLFKVSI